MENWLTLKNDQQGIFVLYNTVSKTYTNGLVKLKKTSYDVIKGRVGNNIKTGNSTIDELDRYHNKHLFEKKEKIMDLALNNSHWEYFVTLTFDDKEFGEEGYSHEKALRLLRRFMKFSNH